ncbi:MAG: damage-control phosphatase ARMT1 family protein [Bacteroidales bacterium]
MISDYRCFFCFTRAFEKLIARENLNSEKGNLFTREMMNLFCNKWEFLSMPEFSREMHIILRNYTNNPDPYAEDKKESNDQALRMAPELDEIIRKSPDPFSTALRLAIAGNIIDFATGNNFNLQATIKMALESDFTIDHSIDLRKKIEKADSILYLGDNAGEIVFDTLFISTIKHRNLKFAVRGSPIINDATFEDALYTGMASVAEVISTGYDAPSVIPEKSSKNFQEYFAKADVIISKGQGNLEGLLHLNDSRIFFLLMAKCDVVAEYLKVPRGSMVIYNPTTKD